MEDRYLGMNESKRLLSVQDAESLAIEEVWRLYAEHINPYQVELLGAFGPGRKRVIFSEGNYIIEADGSKILDLTGGIGVLNHGHNHPAILQTRQNFQLHKRMEVHKSYFSPYVAALSHNIAMVLPGDLSVSYFPNSGAEAVEGAIKLAFKAIGHQRDTVAYSHISFHGKLLKAGGVTGSPENHFKFPTNLKTAKFRFNDVEDLRKVFQDSVTNGASRIYALILEPLNASSMTFATEEFLREARRLCDFHGVALIFDEVYSGWGKTGHLFNFMRVDGLVPDILCYAKSLGGGKASIAGYTASSELAAKAYFSFRDATLHSTTYFGFGEETATAIEAIRIIVDEGLVERGAAIGEKFREVAERTRDFDQKYILSGSGALWGITIRPSYTEKILNLAGKAIGLSSGDKRFGAKVLAGSLVHHLYERHKILTYVGFNETNPLIVSFPLNTPDEEVDYAANALIETLSQPASKLLANFALMRVNGPKAKDFKKNVYR